MKIKKLILIVFLLLSIPITSNAINIGDWSRVETDAGFSVLLPPGWIVYPDESIEDGTVVGPIDNPSILLTLAVTENTDYHILSGAELKNYLKIYTDSAGIQWTIEPYITGDTISVSSITMNGDIAAVTLRSTLDNVILCHAIFPDLQTFQNYAEIVGTIEGSLMMTNNYSNIYDNNSVPPKTEEESPSSIIDKEEPSSSIIDKIQWKYVTMPDGSSYSVPYTWDVSKNDNTMTLSSPDNYCKGIFSAIEFDDPEHYSTFNENVGLEVAEKLDEELYEYSFDYSGSAYVPDSRFFIIPVKSIRNDGIIRTLCMLPKYPRIITFHTELDPYINPDLSDEYIEILSYVAETADF